MRKIQIFIPERKDRWPAGEELPLWPERGKERNDGS